MATYALASYGTAKAAQQVIADEVAILGAAVFRASPLDHRRAKRDHRLAFERLKNFNFRFNRRFRDDIRAERKRAWKA